MAAPAQAQPVIQNSRMTAGCLSLTLLYLDPASLAPFIDFLQLHITALSPTRLPSPWAVSSPFLNIFSHTSPFSFSPVAAFHFLQMTAANPSLSSAARLLLRNPHHHPQPAALSPTRATFVWDSHVRE